MSGFGTYEEAQQTGRPVYLYQFTTGADIYRYNSTEGALDVAGSVFEGSSLAHSEPTVSSKSRTAAVNILLPGSHDLVAGYVDRTPTEKLLVLIQRVHRGDLSDPRYVFSGAVRNVRWTKSTRRAVFICLPHEGRFSKRLPRIGFSPACPNMLFDLNCKATRGGANLFSGSVASVSGDVIVVTGIDTAKGAGWSKTGEVVVTSTGERRTIRDHSATDSLTLMFPFDVNPSGETVEVTVGCGRTLAACKAIQGDVLNFGGTPHVPTKDPFRSGVR